MASLTFGTAGELRQPTFWLSQLVHQAPMIVSMALMATVLRSVLGTLALIAGLWIAAVVRARAARSSVAAREYLVDLLAMGAVLAVPLFHGATAGAVTAMSGMAGMAAVNLGISAALAVPVAWAIVRLRIASTAPNGRVRSVVSGGCCAVGLIAMLFV